MENLRHLLRQHVRQDVDGVGLGFGRRSSSKEDLQQGDLRWTHVTRLLSKSPGPSYKEKH